MTYVRGKSSDYLARLRNQQAIAAAELEHKERELQAIREAEAALARINHKRRVVQDQITEVTSTPRRLPPPIHGGRKGLLEATREAAEHDKRRRQMAAKVSV